MNTKYEKGYVGLIILLISVATIGLIFAFTFLTSNDESDKPESIGRTDIEKAHETIEYGKEAEKTMQLHTDSLSEQMENM